MVGQVVAHRSELVVQKVAEAEWEEEEREEVAQLVLWVEVRGLRRKKQPPASCLWLTSLSEKYYS